MWLPLSIIVILPLLFYLADGYYEKNIKKGAYQIIAFLIVTSVALGMVKAFGMKFILCLPLLLIVFLIINQRKKNGK